MSGCARHEGVVSVSARSMWTGGCARRLSLLAVAVLAMLLTGMTVGGSAAWAALQVSTGAASDVTQFSATLNAIVNPGGAPAGYHFAYGTSSEYGSVIPQPDLYLTREAGETHVEETVVGLQAGTTYHFTIVASSPGGVATGTDATFTTLSIPPPVASTGVAEAVTRGEAVLTGAVEPMGWTTTYVFEYGTSTAYGSIWPTVPASIGGLSGSQPAVAAVSNLQPGTLYHYRLVAVGPGGSSYGPDRTFTTESYPVSVVQEPTILATRLGIAPPTGTIETAKPKHSKQRRGKGRRKKSRSGGKRKSGGRR